MFPSLEVDASVVRFKLGTEIDLGLGWETGEDVNGIVLSHPRRSII
jgi:hypothetical protein